MDELKVSLICAISKTSIKTPVRSATCTHLQCFDLDNFIATNANKETMKCPICGVEIEAFKLVVDKYFQSVLSIAAKENATEVELLRDGGFRFPKPPVYSALISVVEELIDLSDDEQEQGEAVNAEESVRRVAKNNGPYRRWCVTCEICGKRYKNEASLSEHKSRAHVPQVDSGRLNQ
ncbi:MIZ zinc finger family protein [Aphelenchoides avenae]|nr:MIZ zinc finger family protein [Aphelenchus avenae]